MKPCLNFKYFDFGIVVFALVYIALYSYSRRIFLRASKNLFDKGATRRTLCVLVEPDIGFCCTFLVFYQLCAREIMFLVGTRCNTGPIKYHRLQNCFLQQTPTLVKKTLNCDLLALVAKPNLNTNSSNQFECDLNYLDFNIFNNSCKMIALGLRMNCDVKALVAKIKFEYQIQQSI